MAWVASVGKRAKAEVCVKNLTLEEKIQFEKAKDAELNCWIQTNALKPISETSSQSRTNPKESLDSYLEECQ